MACKITMKRSAARDLEALPRPTQVSIARKIDALAKNPFLRGSRKLQAKQDLRRVRVGDYRVIYEVRQTVLVVLVVRIRHRGDACRR